MKKKNAKLRKAAQGRGCTLLFFPYCEFAPETTVLAHLPSNDNGMGTKSPDWWGVHACSRCHDILDGRLKTEFTKEQKLEQMLRGLYMTQRTLIEEGLIKLP